tara:strand:+ start:211 stop:378 length:168 start_codon:yes stop_codon:yes gene_type:complete
MSISKEELDLLCSELGRIYNLMREDYDDVHSDLLRMKLLSCWKELEFYLDSLGTP